MDATAADTVLQALHEGNLRHQACRELHPNQSRERRQALRQGQRPRAIVLGCSDSRVPPELVFDQGLGDLFVVRVAGNVVDDAVVASLEFAVEHLRVPLLVVLGHQGCGAVKATLESLSGAAHGKGRLGVLVDAISPAAQAARHGASEVVDTAVRIHVQRTVTQLAMLGPFLSARVSEGELRIVGAYYGLDSGTVEWLGTAAHDGA